MSPTKILILLAMLGSLSIVASFCYWMLNRFNESTERNLTFFKGFIVTQWLVIILSITITYSKTATTIGRLLPESNTLVKTMSTLRYTEIGWATEDSIIIKGLCYAYTLGLVLAGFWLIASYSKMRRLLLNSDSARLGGIDFRVSSDVHSPFSFGLINPQIFIPRSFLERADFPVILEHEKRHLTHQDPRWKVFSLVTRSLQFFNPLAYYLHRTFEMEMEIHCDAETIRHSKISKTDYGHILIDTAVQLQKLKPNPLFSYMSETNLKKRIIAMKTTRRSRPIVRIISSLALALSGLSAVAVASDIHKGTGQYRIRSEIFLNGVLLSNPRIVTFANEPAKIKVEAKQPHSVLRWEVVASDSSMPQMPNGIELKTELEYKKGSLQFYSRPYLVVAPGEEALVQIGENGGNTLELRVIADRL